MAEEVANPVYSPMMREVLPEERPRERLCKYGEASMGTADLLAIIMNTGIKGESVLALSHRLLNESGGLRGIYQMDFEELARKRGIGESKASRIKAALELGRRLAAAAPGDRMAIEAPDDVVRLLDTKHRVITHRMIYQGSVNKAQVRIGEMFRDAVRVNATALIFAHNHPSGDPAPSWADIDLTTDAVRCG